MNWSMYQRMKKRIAILASVICLCTVSGCGAQPPVVDMNDTNMTQVSETDMTSDEENMTQMSETQTLDDDKTDVNMTQVSQNGAGIQENIEIPKIKNRKRKSSEPEITSENTIIEN